MAPINLIFEHLTAETIDVICENWVELPQPGELFEFLPISGQPYLGQVTAIHPTLNQPHQCRVSFKLLSGHPVPQIQSLKKVHGQAYWKQGNPSDSQSAQFLFHGLDFPIESLPKCIGVAPSKSGLHQAFLKYKTQLGQPVLVLDPVGLEFGVNESQKILLGEQHQLSIQQVGITCFVNWVIAGLPQTVQSQSAEFLLTLIPPTADFIPIQYFVNHPKLQEHPLSAAILHQLFYFYSSHVFASTPESALNLDWAAPVQHIQFSGYPSDLLPQVYEGLLTQLLRNSFPPNLTLMLVAPEAVEPLMQQFVSRVPANVILVSQSLHLWKSQVSQCWQETSRFGESGLLYAESGEICREIFMPFANASEEAVLIEVSQQPLSREPVQPETQGNHLSQAEDDPQAFQKILSEPFHWVPEPQHSLPLDPSQLVAEMTEEISQEFPDYVPEPEMTLQEKLALAEASISKQMPESTPVEDPSELQVTPLRQESPSEQVDEPLQSEYSPQEQPLEIAPQPMEEHPIEEGTLQPQNDLVYTLSSSDFDKEELLFSTDETQEDDELTSKAPVEKRDIPEAIEAPQQIVQEILSRPEPVVLDEQEAFFDTVMIPEAITEEEIMPGEDETPMFDMDYFMGKSSNADFVDPEDEPIPPGLATRDPVPMDQLYEPLEQAVSRDTLFSQPPENCIEPEIPQPEAVSELSEELMFTGDLSLSFDEPLTLDALDMPSLSSVGAAQQDNPQSALPIQEEVFVLDAPEETVPDISREELLKMMAELEDPSSAMPPNLKEPTIQAEAPYESVFTLDAGPQVDSSPPPALVGSLEGQPHSESQDFPREEAPEGLEKLKLEFMKQNEEATLIETLKHSDAPPDLSSDSSLSLDLAEEAMPTPPIVDLDEFAFNFSDELFDLETPSAESFRNAEAEMIQSKQSSMDVIVPNLGLEIAFDDDPGLDLNITEEFSAPLPAHSEEWEVPSLVPDDKLTVQRHLTEEKESLYTPGQKVYHSRYGEGVVRRVISMDNDQLVLNVQFEGIGKRLLDPKLTHLELSANPVEAVS